MVIKTERPEITTALQNAPGPPVMITFRSRVIEVARHLQGVQLHLVVFAMAFLAVCSRRPDAVLNPQFWAEDGVFFYHDAYQLGIHSLFLTYGGYFHTVPRLVALLTQILPFAWAPMIMNLAGITIQVLPVNVFLSSRFSNIAFPIRLLAGFIYLGLPNSFEINANLANVQWHLALLACLVLLAQPARTTGWRVFDGIAVCLTSLSSPMGILLVPVAAVLWWKRRNTGSATSLAVLIPSAAIPMTTLLLHWHGRQAPHSDLSGQTIFNGGTAGANFHYLAAILGRQVFFSSLLGLNTQNSLVHLRGVFAVEVTAVTVGLAVLVYVLLYAPIELKLFILFASTVLALDLVNPLAGPPDHPQWYWLCLPGCGNRYYFLPMLAFLASLLWVMCRKASPGAIRYFALALLLLLPIGIYQDWRYPAFGDFRFREFAKKFESVPSGTTFVIPINPGWRMELTKH